MRQRNSTRTDRRTGAVTWSTERLPSEATFAGRLRELKDHVLDSWSPADGPVEAASATLTCNGCGVTAELDWADPQLPPGWAERPDGDFCPACAGEGAVR